MPGSNQRLYLERQNHPTLCAGTRTRCEKIANGIGGHTCAIKRRCSPVTLCALEPSTINVEKNRKKSILFFDFESSPATHWPVRRRPRIRLDLWTGLFADWLFRFEVLALERLLRSPERPESEITATSVRLTRSDCLQFDSDRDAQLTSIRISSRSWSGAADCNCAKRTPDSPRENRNRNAKPICRNRKFPNAI